MGPLPTKVVGGKSLKCLNCLVRFERKKGWGHWKRDTLTQIPEKLFIFYTLLRDSLLSRGLGHDIVWAMIAILCNARWPCHNDCIMAAGLFFSSSCYPFRTFLRVCLVTRTSDWSTRIRWKIIHISADNHQWVAWSDSPNMEGSLLENYHNPFALFNTE